MHTTGSTDIAPHTPAWHGTTAHLMDVAYVSAGYPTE